MKDLTGTTRWSDGGYPQLLSPHQRAVGVCKGFQARLDALEAWQAQRGPNLEQAPFGTTSVSKLPCREPCSSSFLGQGGVFRPPRIRGTLSPFWVINGGDFNVRDPRLYQLARQRDLDVTQAMAFEALKGVPAARAGQVGRRGAQRPAASRPYRLQQNTRGKTKYGLWRAWWRGPPSRRFCSAESL